MLNDFESRYGTRDAFNFLSDRLGIARPRRFTEFAYGACFYASGRSVSRHPRWVYERAKDFLLETDDQAGFQGFVLERFWPYLVSGVSYESLADCYRSVLANRPLAVYCAARGMVWFKRDFAGAVIEDPNTVAITLDKDGVHTIPGIDVTAADESSAAVGSLEDAVRLFSSKFKEK